MTFIVRPLRFRFLAKDPIFFPAHKPGNVLRGAFGLVFRELACRCLSGHEGNCPYARIFEPKSMGLAPSGFTDLPRPFVIRAHHLDGRRVAPGERFHFDANLFTQDAWPLPYFEGTFAKLATQGMGPGRGRALFEGMTASRLEFSLNPPPAFVDRVTVDFVTPTELKAADRLIAEPFFEPLIARLRDRISNLGEQYGDGPLTVDFLALAARASGVRLAESDIRHVEAERRSSRTGQTHPLSGFVGRATYTGDLAEFIPYLQIGEYTGVGRQTVWGKGELKLVSHSRAEVPAYPPSRDRKEAGPEPSSSKDEFSSRRRF